MKEKVLMLWPVKEDYWPRKLAESNLVDIDNTYNKLSFVGNIIKKICVLNGLFISKFAGEWKKSLEKYDVIIVQASDITQHLPSWIRKKGYKGRIIYWYWDPVEGSVSPNKIDRSACEIWSFDKKDCKVFDMQYNSTYYIPVDKDDKKHISDKKYDICYIGRDKGRLKELKVLEKRYKKIGLKTYFYIVATKPYYLNAKKLKKPIDYEKVIEIVRRSKAILDINQDGQIGLSLRCMESLFENKKLITNNKGIYKENFYNDSNFFVLENLEDDIYDFINKESEDLSDYREYYSFKNWLARFKM